uniref:Cytochrome b-c1 complex subunit 7 n=1 Tax=Romanomermis culicivorax TaxID=13658 RepID=A0A915IHP5_ROMCU
MPATNPHFMKYYSHLSKMRQHILKFFWHNDRFREYGMLYHDTASDINPIVEEAMNRMPAHLIDARHERTMRACLLDLKNDVLPRDQWTKWEDETYYMTPYIREVQEEIRQHTYYRSKRPFWFTKYHYEKMEHL